MCNKRNRWFDSDEAFDQLYPALVRQIGQQHWTPLHIAKKAAGFLAAENNVRVLDIGSGAGKFCLAAAYYRPGALYYGIEQRDYLVGHAEAAQEKLGLNNVFFRHGNFTALDMGGYDHFYFFNAFFEQISLGDKIDDNIHYSEAQYEYYQYHLYSELGKKPAGTRLATLDSGDHDIPPGYREVEVYMDGLLQCWIKR